MKRQVPIFSFSASKESLRQRFILVAICLVSIAAGIGAVISHAATSTIAVESEAGTRSGTLVQCQDSQASGGSAIKFGNPSCLGTYKIPIVSGTAADPVGIAYYKGFYYLSYNNYGTNNQPFSIRKAASLADLASAPLQAIFSQSSVPADIRNNSGTVCNILHWNAHWYCYTEGQEQSTGGTTNFVIESAGDDPMGPYTYKSRIAPPSLAEGGDGHSYQAASFYVSGKLYMTQVSAWGTANEGRLFIAAMSNPWTPATSWRMISQPQAQWECADGRCVNEGSSVVVRGNKVFLAFSATFYEQPNYCVGLLTADLGADLTQPSSWTKSPNPVLKRNDAAGVYGPGNATFFKSPDGTEDWYVYHYNINSTVDTPGAGRRVGARKLDWNSDGTPNFGLLPANGSSFALPSGDPKR